MSNKILFIFFIILSSFLWNQEAEGSSSSQIYVVQLNNGDTLSGEILKDDGDIVIIRTAYGDIEIIRDKIISINKIVPAPIITSQLQSKLNQEARWRTIYLGMSTANTLYGAGIPYVLDIWQNEPQIAGGFQLLMFGGSFYAVYKYTEGMDLPYGRSKFQYSGAVLGGYSILPIMAAVGFENWWNFDEEGKFTLLYEMVAIPYGVVIADRLYHKWGLTNGQSTIVSSAPALGAFNTTMLLTTIYEDGWDDENFTRLYIPLIYGGALAHGYWAKNYVHNKPYTEDDGLFLQLSTAIGAYNSILLWNILEIENRNINRLLFLTGINGFTYLGDKVNERFDLKKGQTGIIALGTFASSIIWAGTAMILNLDDEKVDMVGSMTSVTLGWYLTHKKLANSSKYSSNNIINKFVSGVSITPAFQIKNKNIIPALNFRINF